MPFILLDRDGVINYDSDYYIKSPDEWNPIDGSLEAIAQLTKAGYRIIIVTNQSGVARGLYDLFMLKKIHEKLLKSVAMVGGKIEDIFFCPHHPDERCLCRKPQPGLLYQIKEKYNLEFSSTFFVGDSLCDIQVAQKVGCNPILLLSGNGKKMIEKYPELKNVKQYSNLQAFVEVLCNKEVL